MRQGAFDDKLRYSPESLPPAATKAAEIANGIPSDCLTLHELIVDIYYGYLQSLPVYVVVVGAASRQFRAAVCQVPLAALGKALVYLVVPDFTTAVRVLHPKTPKTTSPPQPVHLPPLTPWVHHCQSQRPPSTPASPAGDSARPGFDDAALPNAPLPPMPGRTSMSGDSNPSPPSTMSTYLEQTTSVLSSVGSYMRLPALASTV
jgi:hypothetical protein